MKDFFDSIPDLSDDTISLRRITPGDAQLLGEFIRDDSIYRYLPTFLFERKFDDPVTVIERMYTQGCEEGSLLLGVYPRAYGRFAGIVEIYGYKESMHKVCIGYRLSPQMWGKGYATRAAGLLSDYLLENTHIEIITASSMVENGASARVLEKCGFTTVTAALEDWGFSEPVKAYKWFK